MDPLADDANAEASWDPASQIRRLDGRADGRTLRVFMWLRGREANDAWLTLSDDRGVVHFSGPVPVDGAVEVVLPPSVDRVRVLLETASWHRQAFVGLHDGLTEHVFE
jgi:hypothetical protein